jgi:hypothetical protein
MIYVVHILNWRFAKLGYSSDKDISKRIAKLQTGNPFEIKIGLSVSGTIRQEKTLHSLLESAISVHGHPVPPNEWYHGRSSIFKEFSEALSYGFDYGFAYLASLSPEMNAIKCEKKERFEIRREWPAPGNYLNLIDGQLPGHEAPNKGIQTVMLKNKKHIPKRIRAIIEPLYLVENLAARSVKPETLTI